MTVLEALNLATSKFNKKKVEGPEPSARFLLRKVLGYSREDLYLKSAAVLTAKQEKKFREWIARRSRHEPVWYITGEIEFFGLDYKINENVLIPRPETEIMVERILKDVEQNISPKKVLDIGTGAGPIIITLASKIKKGNFYASDISEEAVNIAKKNAREAKVRVNFKNGDLFEPWGDQKFNLICANLPYIPHEDMSSLAFDLIHYEPRVALDGGEKGLEIYRRFFIDLPPFLDKKARVYCEIGNEQGDALKKIAEKSLPGAKVKISSDYSSLDRFLSIET